MPLKTERLVARAELASERAARAWQMLSDCRFCAHDCGVNRLIGEEGCCHAGSTARYFSARVEMADELELLPTFAVAFNGCDLRCGFCITGESSWNSRAGRDFDAAHVAVEARRALDDGARSVMIFGGEPTIHLPAVLRFVAALPESATLVWKTNGHASVVARELLDGMFDLWVVDYKFGNDGCAERLSYTAEYTRIVRENLLWANEHTHLIVRHLLMPGHAGCCWRPIAAWLAEKLPGVCVSLRRGFWPAWHSARHPELRGTTTRGEEQHAFDLAEDLELNLVC